MYTDKKGHIQIKKRSYTTKYTVEYTQCWIKLINLFQMIVATSSGETRIAWRPSTCFSLGAGGNLFICKQQIYDNQTLHYPKACVSAALRAKECSGRKVRHLDRLLLRMLWRHCFADASFRLNITIRLPILSVRTFWGALHGHLMGHAVR